ncbi:hypothetical protein M758_4G128100 [Ceratodon purpureus]|nr:hypothetical protein M758_4G128100 [Ceratodon purpureus]
MVTQSELDVDKLLLPEGIIAIPPPCSLRLPTTSGTHVELQAENHQHWTKKAIVPFVVLTLVQFLTATFQTLAKVALTSGINPLFFTFYRNVVAFFFLLPFAYFLERDIRPKLTLHTIGSFTLLAFFAILANQQFFLAGLALTSTLFTGVSQNIIPAITFLLATFFGMEKISFRRTSDLAKILGTVVCITGAVTMTLYKGIALYQQPTGEDKYILHGPENLHLSFKHLGLPQALQFEIGSWALGVLCLFLNCTSWGLYLIHQGPALKRYPALLSMVTFMELFGCIQVAIVGVACEGTQFLDFRSITLDQFMIVLYGGILVSAINLVLQAWCVGQVGPFLVSLFSPVQTLLVALMAVLILGDTLYMGILIGGILIIGGFYIVMCGKQMERRRSALALKCSTNPAGLGDTKQSDLEEPLLS